MDDRMKDTKDRPDDIATTRTAYGLKVYVNSGTAFVIEVHVNSGGKRMEGGDTSEVAGVVERLGASEAMSPRLRR
eukprot:6200871-Pleurochrysis_carterae.AAC.1